MSSKELQEKIDAYFALCESEGAFPDEAGMLLFIGLTRDRSSAYLTGSTRRTAGYRRALERARLRRESIMARGIFAYEKSAAGKIFLARQDGNASARDTEPKRVPEVRLVCDEELLG